MRIGIDLSSISAYRTGTANYTYHLVRHLLEIDSTNEYFLFYRPRSRSAIPFLNEPRSNVHPVCLDAPLTALYHQMRLPVALRRHRIDVYHSTGYFLPLLWPGVKVVTIHDVNFIRFRSSWWRRGTRLAYLDLLVQTPLSALAADQIITDSESSKLEIVRLLRVPTGKVEVIYLGAAPYLSQAPPSDDMAAAHDRFGVSPFFLYVGVISPHKNLERLIQAFSQVRQATDIQVNLILVGKPFGEEYRRRLAGLITALGLDKAVIFTNYVNDATLRALYHSALALVTPYLGEGFGLPVLEAMTCGTPVITSRLSSLPEVAGDAALYVDPYNVEAIGDAMRQMLTDATLREALARRGAERSAIFSWSYAAQQTLAVYTTAYRQQQSR